MSTAAAPSLPQLLAPLNATLMPWLQAGWLNPLLFTAGLIVLEVPGRNSGVQRRVPLVGYLAGSIAIVGTVRGENSQWLKNLAAADHPELWLWGRRWPAQKLHVGSTVACLQIG